MKLLFSFFNYFLLFVFVYFLPIQVFAATIVYEITKGVVAYQVSVKGEVFFEKNLTIEYKGGQLVFSSNPDGTGATYADDAVIMTFKKQGTSVIKTFKHEYEYSCRDLRSLPPKDLTSYLSGEGTYDINVKIKDECGYYAASSAMYLVNINAPEPSVTPTPTPPEPFLDLPWNYDCKQAIDPELNKICDCQHIPDDEEYKDEKKKCESKKQKLDFSTAAQNINSYFDHTYPLLSSGLDEPATLSAQVTLFTGESYLEERRSYSSHDGYDYGRKAGVKDGDPIFAAASGSATYKIGGAPGNMILIDHDNGFQTRYMHMYLDGMIASPSGQQRVWVEAGEQIGRVGHTGNCYSLDRFGNRIYNTADCAHIHFDVTRDKEWKSGEGNFADNIPDGMTDPFGWEVTKDESDRNVDPWEYYSFFYNGKQRTGTKSYYLWKKKIPNLKDTVTETGGTYTLGDFKAVVKPDTFFSPVTLYMNFAPSAQATDSVRSIGPVIDIKVKNILGDFVTLLTKPVDLIWYPFNNTDLSRFKIGTFYLYSSKDGNAWTKETEVNPFNPGEITAAASHFTYFAIMGERKDMIPPTTSVELIGDKGKDNWFRSDVELKLTATDSADVDPAGVKHTYYKINDGEWILYEDKSIYLTEEMKYTVSYYSSDNDENIGDLKSIEIEIDKTVPVLEINATPDFIWPPNGKMVDVLISGDIIEDNLKSKSFEVIDEYGQIQPVFTDFNHTIQLEAKRNGNDKDGRTYIIEAIAEDLAGNVAEVHATFLVPHDQSK